MRDTLIVAERLGLLRDGLVAVLAGARAQQQGRGAVRPAATIEQTMTLLAQDTGGVLLLDLGLLEGGAPNEPAPSVRSIRARFPYWRIVALAETETRDGILQCLAAGAHGYVARTAAASELVHAVEMVAQGGVHVPAALAAPVPVAPIPVAPASAVIAPASQLTGRQRDVLRLLAEGRSTKDIARTLDLAVSTIKVHLAAVYRTVGARNRVEALCRAGLLPLQPQMF